MRQAKFNWAMLPLGACALFEMAHLALARSVPSRWLFSYDTGNWPFALLVILSAVMCVAMVIKIWNNTRMEMNLEQNQQLLLRARMEALTSQINPHFLIQYAEYSFVADSLRPGHGARGGAETFQYFEAPATQA